MNEQEARQLVEHIEAQNPEVSARIEVGTSDPQGPVVVVRAPLSGEEMSIQSMEDWERRRQEILGQEEDWRDTQESLDHQPDIGPGEVNPFPR
jgi:hypothetical protein